MTKKEMFTYSSMNTQQMLWNNALVRTNQIQTTDSWFDFLYPEPPIQYFYDLAPSKVMMINQKGIFKNNLYKLDISEYKGG